MSTEEVFKYVPFKNNTVDIRLLILFPGEEWSTIQCGIQTVALHRNDTIKAYSCSQPYSALSYAWGQPQYKRSIILEGKVATVRETLWMALFYLRCSTESLTIWVDALCIDQGNVQERNSQVARMVQIYGAAERVIVWLGLPSEDSYAALRLFQSKDLLGSKKHSENMEKYWRSVEDICLRPYWKRLWIVQEVIRAVKITVQCGTAVVGWNELSNGLEIFQNRATETNDSKIEILQRVLRLVHHRKQYHQSGCGLIQLLETFGNSVCFDPRDKVYGLLGLANDCKLGAVTADYNKSTEEVFEEVVAFYYHQSLELEISQTNMNWRCPGMCGEDVELNVFHFVGFLTGTVGLLGPMLHSATHSLHQRSNLLATWYYAIRPHSLEERHHVYESIKSGLASVFELDKTRTSKVLSIESSTSHATIGPRAKEAIIGAPTSEDSTGSQSNEHLGSVRLALIRRKRATWISLVPSLAQVNDIVATFYDCDVVLILRPLGGAHCQVLGTAVLIPCTQDSLLYGPDYKKINQYGSGGEEIAFHVDIKTLQLLVL
ncbi:Heterokaryon incompatibility protein 6,OR allele [Lachnellula subtilissima]|uniref:Heterokaryon incompatibility protein 6,OR allele n=1 Tax=Lachnellula subtilissima TaxID=602034 RepID=A0A8H8UGK6_9HELO|nr:Heterokaryon incompatibility protein 6,OR allele [Lachnellula subtilissima]